MMLSFQREKSRSFWCSVMASVYASSPLLLAADERPQLLVAEEIGLVGGDGVEEVLHLLAALVLFGKQVVVLLERVEFERPQPLTEAVGQERLLLVRQGDAGLVVDEPAKQLELGVAELGLSRQYGHGSAVLALDPRARYRLNRRTSPGSVPAPAS